MKAKAVNGPFIGLIKRLSTSQEKDILKINSIYFFTLITTFVVLLMFWTQFLFPQFHVGLTRSFVYYSVLTIYVVYKEIKRWLGKHGENRFGGTWVLLWWSSVMLMEIIAFVSQEKFQPPVEQYVVAVAVSMNFLLSRLSKCLHYKKTGRKKVAK